LQIYVLILSDNKLFAGLFPQAICSI
jgi:hypothetical protein